MNLKDAMKACIDGHICMNVNHILMKFEGENFLYQNRAKNLNWYHSYRICSKRQYDRPPEDGWGIYLDTKFKEGDVVFHYEEKTGSYEAIFVHWYDPYKNKYVLKNRTNVESIWGMRSESKLLSYEEFMKIREAEHG